MTPALDKNMSGDFSKNVLSQLLAKPENKTCADCLGKGPRWASWNLGVVLCIRCSGIHRSLGVHISRVKSVTLDSWNEEQLVCICSRGNGWAKEMYEAKFPEGFQRPNKDVDLEHFIREKYEKRKYWSPVEIPLRSLKEFAAFAGKDRDNLNAKKKDVNGNVATEKKLSDSAVPRPKSVASRSAVRSQPSKVPPVAQPVPATVAAPPKEAPRSNLDDLLGLGTPAPQPIQAQPASSSKDLFSPTRMMPPQQQQPFPQAEQSLFAYNTAQTPSQFQQAQAPQQPQQPLQNQASNLLSKDKILSLYSHSSQQPAHQHPYMAAGNFQPQPPMVGGYGGFPQQQAQMMPPSNMVYQNMPQAISAGYQQSLNMQAMQQMQWQQQQQQLQVQMQGMRIQQTGMQAPFAMQQSSSLPNSLSHAPYGAPDVRSNSMSQPPYNTWQASSHHASNQTLSANLWK